MVRPDFLVLYTAIALLLPMAVLSLRTWQDLQPSVNTEERTRFSERHASWLSILATAGSGVLCLFLLGATVRLSRYRQREQETTDLLQATLSSIGDAVITTDTAGLVTFMNPVAEQLTGWPLTSARARPVHEIFPIVNRFTRQSVDNPVAKVLQSGAIVGLANHTVLLARDGVERHIDDCGAPIRGHDGRTTGVVLVFRDVSERYYSQLALEASERRYRMLFENNPQPMWMFDVDTLEFLDVNDSAIAHYGYTREEFLSMTLRELRPSQEELAVMLQDVANHRTMRHSDGPWRHRRKDGSIIQVEITAVPIEFEGRGAKFVLVKDITSRQEMEATLRRGEERYRVIMETASDAIVTIDENSTVVFASAPLRKIFGYEPTELVGGKLTALMPERLRAAHLAGFQRYLATNERHVSWNLLELPGLRKDGSEVPLELSFGEFRDGTRRRFTGVIRDVSERHQALESLRQTKDLIQAVFHTVPLAIWGIDLLGNVTFWNSAAEWLFGWSEAEVIGGQLPVVPEDQVPEYQQWLGDYAEGHQHVAIERKRLRKDGIQIDCALWTAPLRSASGAITGTGGILADISERKRAEQGAASHVRSLARTNAELQQLAYSASHDLQEPLRQVITQTQMFERQFGHLVPPEAHEYLSYAREGAFRIRAQVEALLDYWNIQHRKLRLRPTPLNAALQQALARLGPTLAETQATLTCDTLPDVQADEILAGEVFYQLLDNSLKFRSDAAPAIHISARDDERYWTVSVRDNGIGMEPEYVEQTFRIFQRLSRNYPGVGIGLSLCKQIMERHEGRISIETAPNAGTAVHIQFPRRA